jgi:hypothetical protein
MLLAVQQHFVRAAPMSGTKLYSFVPPSLIAPCSQLLCGDVLAHNCNRTNPFLCAQSHRQPPHSSLGSIHSYVTTSFQHRAVHPLPSVVMLAVRPSPAFRGCIGTTLRLLPCHIPPLHCAPIAAVTGYFTGRPRRWHSPSVSVHSSLIHSLGRLPARKTKYNISVENYFRILFLKILFYDLKIFQSYSMVRIINVEVPDHNRISNA